MKKLILWTASLTAIGFSACSEAPKFCENDAKQCSHQNVEICRNGVWEVEAICEGQNICNPTTHLCEVPEPCKNDTKRCSDKDVEVCKNALWEIETNCSGKDICNPTTFLCEAPPACLNSAKRCKNSNVEICAYGIWEIDMKCSKNNCDPKTNQCGIPRPCTDDARQCRGMNVEICKNSEWEIETTCKDGRFCDRASKTCELPQPCQSDAKRCTHKGVEVCQDGAWKIKEHCEGRHACNPVTHLCEAPMTDDDFAIIDKAWNDRAPKDCQTLPHAKRPTANDPKIPNREREYTIELERWRIKHDSADHVQTADAINEAIAWAHDNDYGTIRLPAGLYNVGKLGNDVYTEAIKLPSNTAFILDDEAILQMAPCDTWNYCVIDIFKQTDVIVSGGTIRGERDGHIYKGGGAHDEGHIICVWNESERVLIENTTLTNGTGDGVLIVGGGPPGSSSKHITIRNNHIHHQRRQGISIIGGTNVVIENNEIHHIAGREPQFGIDIESMTYNSQDILIRKNHFYANKGGDLVNTDGTNVWFEYNICDQTGTDGRQTDGPIVHWDKTDQVIQGNTITVTDGNSNGRWGIIGYSRNNRKNPAPNYIIDNVLNDGGIHMSENTHTYVAGNIMNGFQILGNALFCLVFDDNKVNYKDRDPYKFRNVFGTAQGNWLNGEAHELAMDPNVSFTNSPPSMW